MYILTISGATARLVRQNGTPDRYAEEENALKGDDEPECTMDTEEPVPHFWEALGHLDAFTRYCDANGVPRKVGESAVQLSRELQNHRLSIPTLNPTLFHYFPKK